jgi:cAMP-dependent protein kinase regulator
LPLEYGPGETFGELALMYNAPRSATIKSLEPCDLWRLDQNSFKSIVMGAAIKKRERYTGFLESVPLLGELDAYERMVLADALEERKYNANEVIVNQDDPGDEFFIIASGTVLVERDGKFMSSLGEGRYFGEIALLTSKLRQATVTASSDATFVLTVHRKVFQRVLGPLADILGRNMQAYSSLLIA